jgi:hypothetical protein
MAIKQVFNSSAELNYPVVSPTLNLDFANTKTLDPRITFTRASGGSYVGADGLIKYAGVNEARFDHDPETGESLGLLIEEARTNLFNRSEDFSAAKTDVSNGLGVNVNSIESPDGTKSADKVFIKISDDSQANGLQFNIFTPVANQPYTTSCFLKMDEMRYVRYVSQGGGISSLGVNVDLLTGKIISSVGSPNNFSITPYPNGWYRISVTVTPISTASLTSRILALDPSGQVLSFLGVIGSGFYIWGIQMEQASFATSYIPTQASTRTRAGDRALITGKNFSDFYRQDEGSIFIEFLNTPSSTPFPTIYSISDLITGAGQNRIRLVKFETFSSIRISDITNGIVQSTYDISSGYNVFDNIKAIRTYGFKNYIGSVNGTTPRPPGIFNVENPTPSKLMSIMSIGTAENGNTSINAPIKRFIYYPKALPPSQIQALTS